MFVNNFLTSTINLIGFFALAFVFWYLPGSLIIKSKEKINKLDRIFLTTLFGFAVYCITIFIVRLLGLPFWIGYLPFIFVSLTHLKKLKSIKILQPKLRLTQQQKMLLILIILGTLIQGIALMKSAVHTKEGLKFLEISAHDSLQHIYLINELKDYFPPRHPGFAPVLTKNYHYILDLTVASLGKYLPLSTFELYYRIVPAAVSIALGISVFIFTRKLTKSELAGNIAVFLVYFSGNAAWFVKLFRGPEFQVSANSFMLDPIIDLMQNPIAVIVFPLMLAGTMGLMYLEKKFDWRWIIYSSMVFGVMIGFKAWGGTLMALTLPIYALLLSIQKKNHAGWLLWIVSLSVTLILFLPVYEQRSAANPVFAPGWLLNRMIEDPDRYNYLQYYFLEQYYSETGNNLRLIQIQTTKLLIFLLGNLWISLLGLIYFVKSLRKLTPSKGFMLAIITTSLSLPLLFNQGRKAYDIIQFGPYSLVLMSIFTAVSISILRKYIPKKIFVVLIVLLLIISFPSNIKSIKARYLSNSFTISNFELKAYDFLRNQTDLQSNIMVYPSKRNDATLEVSALSGRPTYFSGKSFAGITGNKGAERAEEWRSFFKHIDPERRGKAIREGSINYIVLTPLEDKEFNPAGINLEKSFANEAIIIYKIR